MLPRLESVIDLADCLQNRLRSEAGNDIFPLVILINGVRKHQVHEVDKVIDLLFFVRLCSPAAGANPHANFVQIGFRNVEIKKVRCYEVVQVVGLIEMYQRVNQSEHINGRLGHIQVTACVGMYANSETGTICTNHVSLPVFANKDCNALFFCRELHAMALFILDTLLNALDFFNKNWDAHLFACGGKPTIETIYTG